MNSQNTNLPLRLESMSHWDQEPIMQIPNIKAETWGRSCPIPRVTSWGQCGLIWGGYCEAGRRQDPPCWYEEGGSLCLSAHPAPRNPSPPFVASPAQMEEELSGRGWWKVWQQSLGDWKRGTSPLSWSPGSWPRASQQISEQHQMTIMANKLGALTSGQAMSHRLHTCYP